MVMAPEQEWMEHLVSVSPNRKQVSDYIEAALRKTEMERTATDRIQDGVDTGLKARNPLTGEAIPVWVADYVIESYGTGAIMAVPAHDERDYAFAKRYDLVIRRVIEPAPAEQAPDEKAYKRELKKLHRQLTPYLFEGRSKIMQDIMPIYREQAKAQGLTFKEEFISETTHEARYPLDEFTRKCIEIVLSKFPDGYIEVIYPGIKL